MTCTLFGCSSDINATSSVSDEEVVLKIAGSWPDCRALELVASEFSKKYPNCTISYEYLQDYTPSLMKRMEGEESIDLFFTNNIQKDSELLPYALDLNGCEGLDLSHTFQGLIDNFTYRDADNGANASELYAIPLGAELRGMYVNRTLLKTMNLEVPTDQASLLDACRVLKEGGYIPIQSNPGDFGQTLLYPWISNIIANADDPEGTYAMVNAREPGVSELFREPLQFMYTLIENDYYDYKTAQNEKGLFVENSDEDYARYFLNIMEQEDGTFIKMDDVGQVAFMPSPMSLQGVIDKTKEDYHSEIDYAFILSPVGIDGGYAYMSPAHGIAVNKDSEKLDWAIRFMNFLFQPENNVIFAEAFHIIPNTEEALSEIRSLFAISEKHISELGQVTFDYGFYETIVPTLINVSKANNPKYMQDDGNGNVALYPLDFYMEELESNFSQQ